MKHTLPNYANRPERFFAYLIDTIILLAPGSLIVALLNEARIAVIGVFLVSLGYYTYFTASRWQATPGKRMLNLYVARTDHRPLSLRDAVERFLAFILPSLPIYSSLFQQQQAMMLVFWLTLFWFAPILLTPERIGLHDRLCRTRVLTGKVGA